MLRKGLELLHVFLTNAKEKMSVFRISGVVVWQLMCDVFGDFELSIICVLS
jgi:hypothetical protein